MSKVNYTILDESIVINSPGHTEVIASSDKRFNKVKALIKAGTLDEIPSLVTLNMAFDGSGLEQRDGKLYDGTTPLPESLTARLIKLRDMDMPYGPLLKFWENLKANPSFNSRAMLYKFLEHNGHPLTEDGCFIAYKGVREDFRDVHSGTFDNSPGQIPTMDRSAVNDNPNETCSSGLHVACFKYARDFGPRLVEVKINPADVVAVPTDYDGTKMRVCKYEVVAESVQARKEEIYNNPESVYEDESDDLDEDESDEDLDENKCQDCGEEKDAFANFCHECGAEF